MEQQPIYKNINILIIFVAVFLVFNLIGTCSTKSTVSNDVNELNANINKLDSIISVLENKIDRYTPEMQEFFKTEIEKQMLTFVIYEDDIDKNRLSISELKLRLKAIGHDVDKNNNAK